MRYLVFAWEKYEAVGGWNDLIGMHEDLNSAIARADKRYIEWVKSIKAPVVVEVIDLFSGECVYTLGTQV